MKSINKNNQSLKFLMFFFSGIIILCSCTERIDIDLDSTYTRLAVEGHITTDADKQYIRLTKTADYFSNTETPSVSGATVIVSNGSNDFFFSESKEKPGSYFPPEGFTAEQGISYSATIELAEPINDESFFTASEKMPLESTGLDSIAIEWQDTWEFWGIKFYAQEPPTENFYMFNVLVNGIMVTDSIQRISVSDDKLYNGSYTYGVIVQTLYQNETKPGDTVTLVLSNITEGYYNYILEVQSEIRPNNPIFSGPPANVSSNISNNAVGYLASYTNVYISGIVMEKE